MQDDVTVPFFIMGMIVGVIATLLVQAYGRRKAKAATRVDAPQTDRQIELLTADNETQSSRIYRLEERIAVMERIATDRPALLAHEIDSLR